MKNKVALILPSVMLLAVVGLFVFTLLQDPERPLSAAVERAERSLTLYSQDLVRLSDLQRRTANLIAEASLTTRPETEPAADGVSSEDLAAVAEARPEALDRINEAIGEAFKDPIVRHLTSELEGKYQSAGPKPEAEEVPQPRVSATPDGLARLQSEVDKALAENKGLLKAAQREIQQAMSLSEGGVDGRQHAGLNRMGGVVEYHLAADALRQARLTRLETVVPRRRIVTAVQRRARALGYVRHLETQKVGEVAREVSQQRDAVRAGLQQATGELAALQAEIDDLKQQLVEARDEAAKWSAALLAQESKGFPYDDVKAFTAFRERYLAAGKSWREAVARADAILNGTLRNATIEDPDEYLTRPYEPLPGKEITPDGGIVYREKDGAILADRKATLAAQVKTLDAQIEALTKLAGALETQRSAAAKTAEQQGELIRSDVAKVTAIDAAARELEDEALNHANKAARYFKAAGSRVQQEARDASSAARDAPPDAPNERLEMIGKNKDFGGHLAASEADALLIEATVHYQRFVDLRQHLDILEVVEQAGLADAAPPTATEPATDTQEADDEATDGLDLEGIREAGLEAVDGALEQLDKANSALKDHWTVTANRAAAAYLGAKLGKEAKKEAYLRHAKALYEAIAQDPQDDPLLQPYREMLNHINRQSQ